jgi:chaperonin cofactor prefoldin
MIMGIGLQDAKKLNKESTSKKRNAGEVYGVDSKGHTEFISVGQLVIKEFNDKKLHEALKGLDVSVGAVDKRVDLLKEIISKMNDKIEKLEKELSKYVV